MKEDGNASSKGKTTLMDIGRGFMLLGAGVLLLTAVFLVMAIVENEYYGLFSGNIHLTFYLMIGLAFIGAGALLVRRGKQKPTR